MKRKTTISVKEIIIVLPQRHPAHTHTHLFQTHILALYNTDVQTADKGCEVKERREI